MNDLSHRLVWLTGEGADEFYAWYGKAVAAAQLIEGFVSMGLALLPKGPKEPDLDAVLELRDRRTLGQLMKDLKKRGIDGPELDEILERRNYLVHRMFRTPEFHALIGEADGTARAAEKMKEDAEFLSEWVAAMVSAGFILAFVEYMKGRPPGPTDWSW